MFEYSKTLPMFKGNKYLKAKIWFNVVDYCNPKIGYKELNLIFIIQKIQFKPNKRHFKFNHARIIQLITICSWILVINL